MGNEGEMVGGRGVREGRREKETGRGKSTRNVVG